MLIGGSGSGKVLENYPKEFQVLKEHLICIFLSFELVIFGVLVYNFKVILALEMSSDVNINSMAK